LGQVLTYEIVVKDKAGNSNTTSETYTIVEDTAPQIDGFAVATDDGVYEQGLINVSLQLSDNIDLAGAELVWNGFVTKVTGVSGVSFSKTVSLRDQRTERISSALSLPLTLRATDDIGQITEQQIIINLLPDLAPDATQVNVTVDQATDFYGNNAAVIVDNI